MSLFNNLNPPTFTFGSQAIPATPNSLLPSPDELAAESSVQAGGDASTNFVFKAPMNAHSNQIEHMKSLGAPEWGIELMRQVLLLQDGQKKFNAGMRQIRTALHDKRELTTVTRKLTTSLTGLGAAVADLVDAAAFRSHANHEPSRNGPTPPHSPPAPSTQEASPWGIEITFVVPPPESPTSLEDLQTMSDERVIACLTAYKLSLDGTVEQRRQRLSDYLAIFDPF